MRLMFSIGLASLCAAAVLGADRAAPARRVSPQQSLPTGMQAPPSVPAASHGSKVWVGHYAEYEAFLRTAVIDRSKGTTGRVFFEPGGLASSGALHREKYKLEIAGYKMDRVLQLDMVPPMVEVRFDGMASLALWVETTRMLKQLEQEHVRPPDPVKWNYQLNRAHAFEDLVANLDSNQGSPIVDAEWNLIVLDHSLGFTNTLAQPYEIGKTLNQIDRAFFERLKALDRTAVERAIGDLVDPGAIDALFIRRGNLVKGFDELAARNGTNTVFTR